MGVFRALGAELWLVPVRVAVPHAEAAARRLLSRPVPVPVAVVFLLDSGSGRSAMMPSLVQMLQLSPAGRARVQTGTGQAIVTQYEARLEFLDGSLGPIPHTRVMALQVPESLAGVAGVLGRDVLAKWDLCWSGPRQRLTIRDRPSLLSWLCC